MPENVELFIDRQADTICSDLDPGCDASVAAFEALVRAADDGVRVVVYRMVGADVDDVMQTAYLRAFRHWISSAPWGHSAWTSASSCC